MQSRQLYSRTPITEAVIEFRAKLPEEVKLDTLAQIGFEIRSDYPMREEMFVISGSMTVGDTVGATASQTQIGYRFFSDDQKQILQVRLDGFSFSRLAPYERWETFRNEAKRLWSIYQSLANPQTLTRLAVRYINRLDLPLPIKDLKDYLRIVPEISPDLPQGLSGYFMQLQIPHEDLDAMLVLNETLVPPPKPDVASILLDIDLFQEWDRPNDEIKLWDSMEQLHFRVDQIFEACITTQTRELIQ